MPITPDTKDWTWVTREPCGECGFDAGSIKPTDIGRYVRDNAARWPGVLERADAAVRPDDDTWSPLEYACHVRDVFALYRYRLSLILTQDDPLFPNWDQNVAAVEANYAVQDPAAVSDDVMREGFETAEAFDAVPDGAWERTGRRTDGASFNTATFGVYFLHDIVHHIHDVTR